MLRSLPLTVLSFLIGFFFIFIGSIKLTPALNAEIYRDMQQEFGRFNKVFPLYQYTGWRPFARNYRQFVGVAEVIGGSLMVMVPGQVKELSNIVLLGVLGGAFYTHVALGDAMERMAPCLVFMLLTLCRLVILYQVNRKEKQEMEMMIRLIEEMKKRGEFDLEGESLTSQNQNRYDRIDEEDENQEEAEVDAEEEEEEEDKKVNEEILDDSSLSSSSSLLKNRLGRKAGKVLGFQEKTERKEEKKIR
jgi:hypothetical protein